MQHWKYWAFAVSGATFVVVGVTLQATGCTLNFTTINDAIGSCDAGPTDDSGTCECTIDNECPHNFCTVAKCDNGQCKTTSANEGQELPDDQQVPSDCKIKKCIGGEAKDEPYPADKCDKICSQTGECVECNVPSDCPPPAPMDGWRCTATKCASCSNGFQDSDETGTDWGGACPKKSNGTACAGSMECANGVCKDGVCCDTPCTGNCLDCKLAGKEGTCSPVPGGEGDPDTCGQLANGPFVCNALGACSDKTANGDSCASNGNCASGKCDAPDGGVGTCVAP